MKSSCTLYNNPKNRLITDQILIFTDLYSVHFVGSVFYIYTYVSVCVLYLSQHFVTNTHVESASSHDLSIFMVQQNCIHAHIYFQYESHNNFATCVSKNVIFVVADVAVAVALVSFVFDVNGIFFSLSLVELSSSYNILYFDGKKSHIKYV